MAGRPAERLVNKADFERLLGTRWQARSAHFAVHHVTGAPLAPAKPARLQQKTELSTAPAPNCPQPVDDSSAGLWYGCVVPKRHARRAVTRNLLKRQVRSAFERHGERLAAGLWLVRLRSPFASADFISARSEALASAARTELDVLLRQAMTRILPPAAAPAWAAPAPGTLPPACAQA